MGEAKVTSQRLGDVLDISVSGYIGEGVGSTLVDLGYKDLKKVRITLKGVTYLNSVGVKNWVSWISRIPRNVHIEFHQCPALIVAQVNMVVGFIPTGGTVESLTAPLICEDCNVEKMIELTRGKEYQYATKDGPGQVTLPEIPCNKCKQPMTLDAIEAKFFNFIKSIRE